MSNVILEEEFFFVSKASIPLPQSFQRRDNTQHQVGVGSANFFHYTNPVGLYFRYQRQVGDEFKNYSVWISNHHS